MLLQCKDNEVFVLVWVLDCGMLRVEYNIRAYNVVCGMICFAYVPSVLLVASWKSTSFDRWSVRCMITNSRLRSNTSPPLYFVYSYIPDLYPSIAPINKSRLVLVSRSFPSWPSRAENNSCEFWKTLEFSKTMNHLCSCKCTKKKDLFYNKKNDLLHSFCVTMNNNLFFISNKDNDSLPLFHLSKKKQHRIPAFDIAIVYPGSALARENNHGHTTSNYIY